MFNPIYFFSACILMWMYVWVMSCMASRRVLFDLSWAAFCTVQTSIEELMLCERDRGATLPGFSSQSEYGWKRKNSLDHWLCEIVLATGVLPKGWWRFKEIWLLTDSLLAQTWSVQTCLKSSHRHLNCNKKIGTIKQMRLLEQLSLWPSNGQGHHRVTNMVKNVTVFAAVLWTAEGTSHVLTWLLLVWSAVFFAV